MTGPFKNGLAKFDGPETSRCIRGNVGQSMVYALSIRTKIHLNFGVAFGLAGLVGAAPMSVIV